MVFCPIGVVLNYKFQKDKDMRMNIVACTDKWNVMPTGVMIESVCVNNPDTDISFYIVIDDDVTEKQCCDLKEVVNSFMGKTIAFYSVGKELIKNPFPNVNKRIPRATYFRLYLTELLPSKLEKVLYLDGDIIVRHSLDELWKINLSDYALAVVPDMRTGTIDRYNRLRYSPSLGYFNAGVLLINLSFWREHHALDTFLGYISTHQEVIIAHDQDILNYVFREQKLMLPIKYNFQHGYLWETPQCDYWKYEKEIIEARKDPIILHFTSGNKPWVAYQPDPHPFRNSFYKYQDMTKWKGIKVDNRSFKTKIRTALGDVLRWMKIRPVVKNNFIDINPID